MQQNPRNIIRVLMNVHVYVQYGYRNALECFKAYVRFVEYVMRGYIN